MYLDDGKNLVVADGADAFAEAIARVHETPELWSKLARGGLENIRDHFSFDAARPTIASTFRRD
jgi:glycosyltransferase involved in cell wall biosynthesis